MVLQHTAIQWGMEVQFQAQQPLHESHGTGGTELFILLIEGGLLGKALIDKS